MTPVTPFCSIVIASYNRADVLPKAIESVLGQSEYDIECIVVDDGSTDGTQEMVAGYTDTRLHYVWLSENKGASFARNKGIEEAKGKWVMVWDSDDTLDPNAIATLRHASEEHPEAIVVSAPARMLKNGHEITYPEQPEGFVSLDHMLVKYLGNDEKVRMARKEAYRKAPYVARNIDFMVGARLASQGPWFHLNQKLGTVVLDTPGSLTKNRKKFSTKKSRERAPHLKAFLDEFGAKLRQGSVTRYKEILYGAAIACACAGMRVPARHYAKELMTLAPLSPRSYAALLFAILFPGRLN